MEVLSTGMATVGRTFFHSEATMARYGVWHRIREVTGLRVLAETNRYGYGAEQMSKCSWKRRERKKLMNYMKKVWLRVWREVALMNLEKEREWRLPRLES